MHYHVLIQYRRRLGYLVTCCHRLTSCGASSKHIEHSSDAGTNGTFQHVTTLEVEVHSWMIRKTDSSADNQVQLTSVVQSVVAAGNFASAVQCIVFHSQQVSNTALTYTLNLHASLVLSSHSPLLLSLLLSQTPLAFFCNHTSLHQFLLNDNLRLKSNCKHSPLESLADCFGSQFPHLTFWIAFDSSASKVLKPEATTCLPSASNRTPRLPAPARPHHSKESGLAGRLQKGMHLRR
jgi:hypothetical protein